MRGTSMKTVGWWALGLLLAGSAGCSDPGLTSGAGGGSSTTSSSTTTTTTTSTSAVTTGTGGSTTTTTGVGGGTGGSTTTTTTTGTGGSTTTTTGTGGMAGTGGGTTTTGAGGMAGTGGMVGTGGSGGTGGAPCVDPQTQCPPPASACVAAICAMQACSTMNLPAGTVLAQQMSGDCKKAVCDASGGVTSMNDNLDISDDSNPCTMDLCNAGMVAHPPQAAGMACTSVANAKAKLCDGAGTCVECNAATQAVDCVSKVCQANVCVGAQCGDAVKNGSETDVDCGGGMCVACAVGKTCLAGNDCASNVCQGGVCKAPTCLDATKNGSETDVDCGGGACPDCPVGKACLAGNDCVSNVCQGGLCKAPTCFDVAKNGSETDVDCGGGACPACGNGKTCSVPSDCLTLLCLGGACAGGSCSNALKDSAETDVDCGGPVCVKCGSGVACLGGGDCLSGVCLGNVCQAPTCLDGVQNGTETGVDCGGGACALCPTVLLYAGGGGTVLAGEFHPGGAWSTTTLADSTTFAPSAAFLANGVGAALIRSTATGNLRYSLWSAGAFAPFADVGPGVTTREQPSLRAVGNVAHAVFHGDDFKHYYAAFLNGAWMPAAEAVGGGAGQSFGPSPPQIAAGPSFPALTEATVAFINGAGGINKLFARDRAAGVWGAATQVDLSATNFNLAPEVVPLTANGELMVVFVRSDAQIMYAIRTGGVWSAAAPITSATTNTRVAVVAAPGGAAALAFRGQDGNLYTSAYVGGGVWTNPAPFAPTVPITSSPALSRGVGTSLFELAFTKADGMAYHARFVGGAWSAPVAVGGVGMGTVAITSAP